MVALLGAVGIAIGGTADVACIVEPDPEIPAAEATCRRRLLFLAGVHARTHRTHCNGAL
jgi:hypothetical protein